MGRFFTVAVTETRSLNGFFYGGKVLASVVVLLLLGKLYGGFL